MRNWIDLFETHRPVVFHGTPVVRALTIIEQGVIKAKTQHLIDDHLVMGVSTSRSRSYSEKYANQYAVVFELDLDRIKNNTKVSPFDFWGNTPMQTRRRENEEFVMGDIDINHCLVAIHMNQSVFDFIRREQAYEPLLSHPLLRINTK